MKDEQTSLFKLPPKHKKVQAKAEPKQQKPVYHTQAYLAYQALCKAHLANHFRIYSYQKCIDLVLNSIDNNTVTYSEDAEALCKRLKKLSKYGFYHYKDLHFYRLNGWLMRMILKEGEKHAKHGTKAKQTADA